MRNLGSIRSTILMCVLVLLLITCASGIFISQMNGMMESSTMNTINELADHDLVSIQNFLERNWNELDGIQNRMIIYDCQTIQETQERLNLERASGNFYTLYLVDEDGNVYSDRYRVYSPEEMDLAGYLDEDEEYTAVRYVHQTSTESRKEMLLYAVRLQDYTVEGVNFVALAGLSPINAIQDRLALYSFYKNGESRGYSSVVNLEGNFIVNIRQTFSLDQQENLFDILENGAIPKAWTIDEIKEHMEVSDIFYFYFKDSDGVENLLYFAPVDGADWYLILMVERSVFSDLSQTFIVSSISMVAVSVAVCFFAMLFVMKSQKSVLDASAKAQARSEFLSSMSHEIRTPLNGIIGSLHLIRAHINEPDKTHMITWLDKADDTARYLLTLISDFLDMSKLQDGKMELVYKPFLLDRMLDSIQAMQQSNVDAREQDLIIEQHLLCPCVVGDETRLKQVLINIVSNAVKFTPKGGTIRVSVNQEPIDENHVTTTICCADTGIGMSPKFLEHIWDSFSQEHNNESDGTRGTGLGTAISKSIVDAMGGDISVTSALGEGSAFTIVLQMEIADPAAVAAKSAPPAKAPEPIDKRKHMKLMVAEDNELNAEILIEILEEEGFEVVLAENGQQALELFSESKVGEFDAILMDMQMPVMDGCQASQRIRNLRREDAQTVRIFACTANAFQEDRDKALSSGMDDFLTKPIDVGVLLDKLNAQQKGKAETS